MNERAVECWAGPWDGRTIQVQSAQGTGKLDGVAFPVFVLDGGKPDIDCSTYIGDYVVQDTRAVWRPK